MPVVDIIDGVNSRTITDSRELRAYDLAEKIFGSEASVVKNAFEGVAQNDPEFAEWLGEQISDTTSSFRSAKDFYAHAENKKVEYKVGRGIRP